MMNPLLSKLLSQSQDDNASISTRRDADNDVIMKNSYSNNLQQVPEPGFFSGNTNDTDLFCQLCEDTFSTYPNLGLPEEVKINFVKSRLREGARNWYIATYNENNHPGTLKELISDIKKTFMNDVSKKLAKIQLVKLKHSYGKINDYIEKFKTLTTGLFWDEEALVLFFYNGLHPKFQEEIDKMEEFPTTLGDIYTKCILFENNIKSKDQLRNNNGNKNLRKKHSSPHVNNNKNYNNNNNYYTKNKSSNNYFNNNNNNNNQNNNQKKKLIDGLQKESRPSKNLKTIYYNFPTLDSINESNLPSTFLLFKSYIPIKFLNNFSIKNEKIQKLTSESMLDSGS